MREDTYTNTERDAALFAEFNDYGYEDKPSRSELESECCDQCGAYTGHEDACPWRGVRLR